VTPALHRDCRQVRQKPAPEPAAAPGQIHEQIFEIETRRTPERREIVKEQGEADRFGTHIADDHLGVRPGPEQRLPQPGFRGHDVVRQFFVLGQRRDHPQHDRDVGFGSGCDVEIHWIHIAGRGLEAGDWLAPSIFPAVRPQSGPRRTPCGALR
jgi:hypothetical protein